MLTTGKRCIYIKKQVKEFEKEEGKKRIKEKRIDRKGKTSKGRRDREMEMWRD